AATLGAPSIPELHCVFPDFCWIQGQRTPRNHTNKVTEVMEQMGLNCFSLNGLRGIFQAETRPGTGRSEPSISGEIRVYFRRFSDKNRKEKLEKQVGRRKNASCQLPMLRTSLLR